MTSRRPSRNLRWRLPLSALQARRAVAEAPSVDRGSESPGPATPCPPQLCLSESRTMTSTQVSTMFKLHEEAYQVVEFGAAVCGLMIRCITALSGLFWALVLSLRWNAVVPLWTALRRERQFRDEGGMPHAPGHAAARLLVVKERLGAVQGANAPVPFALPASGVTETPGELRANHHAAAEAHNFACAPFIAGALPIGAPACPSERICEFEHARLRNGARRPFGPVGDFLRGRRFNPPRAGVWSVLTHWDEAAAYAVVGHLAPALA